MRHTEDDSWGVARETSLRIVAEGTAALLHMLNPFKQRGDQDHAQPAQTGNIAPCLSEKQSTYQVQYMPPKSGTPIRMLLLLVARDVLPG